MFDQQDMEDNYMSTNMTASEGKSKEPCVRSYIYITWFIIRPNLYILVMFVIIIIITSSDQEDSFQSVSQQFVLFNIPLASQPQTSSHYPISNEFAIWQVCACSVRHQESVLVMWPETTNVTMVTRWKRNRRKNREMNHQAGRERESINVWLLLIHSLFRFDRKKKSQMQF